MTDIKNKAELKEAIIEALRTVFDPEIPVNVYDLGLIYEINITKENNVHVLMTLTSPNCPVAESLPQEIREKTLSVDGVNEAEIELTFEPPWDQELLSEEAKLELGLL
jgi:FeS assembly SUF system protein